MRLNKYLNGLNENDRVTFVIAKAEKRDWGPGHDTVYHTTPVRVAREWKEWEAGQNYIVANEDHPPVDISGTFVNWYNRGDLKCCVLISEDTLRVMYGEKQAEDMIKFYDK